MKRRSFLKTAISLLGTTVIPGGLATPQSGIHYQLLRHHQKECLYCSGGTGVIGLGVEGADAAGRINRATVLPEDLTLVAMQPGLPEDYETSLHPSSDIPFDSDKVVLVLSPNDPWAISLALGLADEMAAHDRCIDAAILLSPPTQQTQILHSLRRKLYGVIYLDSPWNKALSPSYQPLVQTLRQFFAEPGVTPVIDYTDFMRLLSSSCYGVATTTRYLSRHLQGGESGAIITGEHTTICPQDNILGATAVIQGNFDVMWDNIFFYNDLEDINLGLNKLLGISTMPINEHHLVTTHHNSGYPYDESQLGIIFLSGLSSEASGYLNLDNQFDHTNRPTHFEEIPSPRPLKLLISGGSVFVTNEI